MKNLVELNCLFSKLFSENSFVISPGFIRGNTGRLASEAFTSNPIASLKQELSSLKFANWINDFHVNILKPFKKNGR